MSYSESQKNATRKYNEKSYDRLYPFVKKGKKEIYVNAAHDLGISLNEFVEMALDEKIRSLHIDKS